MGIIAKTSPGIILNKPFIDTTAYQINNQHWIHALNTKPIIGFCRNLSGKKQQ